MISSVCKWGAYKMSGDLSVRNLTKAYSTAGSDLTVVSDISFDVAAGEFFTMLGPSGCGKTTTLRMIAGLESVTGGSVNIDGRDTTMVPARHRNIGMVFQSYALFPHLTIYENVAYGLRVRRLSEGEVKRQVSECLDLLALTALANRLPGQLSGGQQQRVSIARALVYRPPVLLLDEPLANLDAKLRVQMRDEIRRVQRSLGIMVLYVTHDQEEAMAISDRVAVFDRGRIAQIGAPSDIYDRPESLFVADFIGKANLLSVQLDEAHPDLCQLPSGAVITPGRVVSLPHCGDSGLSNPREGILMIRPERLFPADEGPIRGRVDRVQNLGPISRSFVVAEGIENELLTDVPRSASVTLTEGDICGLDFHAGDVTLFRRAP
ncbi:Spermidine/putrescine import ATP-binding protein PotA [Hyphomicrobiales bacterium]|nr:Spermidine/putrescine import ATP-binding protein PotA [Hyphomicrobiales bacterium]CAH1695415.1 Spermidine/putrescine import ATP-binding protein PotA [Hyphomicrobiales bacterium]